MNCPKCNSANIRVMDTAQGDDNATYRRKRCGDCGFRFHTVEEHMPRTLGAIDRCSKAFVNKAMESRRHGK